MYIHQITCVQCGNEFTVQYNVDDYLKWQNGALIQDAFPYLNATERELIKTGICGECWDRMFSVPEEE